MKTYAFIVTIAALTLLSGCATNYSPMIDPNSIRDYGEYRANLAECNRYANQIDVGENATGGAIIGALFGAAIGAAAGDRQAYARFGAVVGAIQGAATAGGGAAMTKAQIVRNCLAGRGYVVLDGPVTVPIGVTATQPMPAPTNTTPHAARPSKSKISTAMGMDSANYLFNYKEIIDIGVLEAALEQTLNGEKTALTQEEADQLRQQFMQNYNPAEPPDKNKISTMIGMDVANGLLQYKDDIDIDIFKIALEQTLRDEETALTQEEASMLRERYIRSKQESNPYGPYYKYSPNK